MSAVTEWKQLRRLPGAGWATNSDRIIKNVSLLEKWIIFGISVSTKTRRVAKPEGNMCEKPPSLSLDPHGARDHFAKLSDLRSRRDISSPWAQRSKGQFSLKHCAHLTRQTSAWTSADGNVPDGGWHLLYSILPHPGEIAYRPVRGNGGREAD